MRLPKLERLLLDTDINIELEPLLKAVGFDTEFALRVGVDIRKDKNVLIWARTHRRILVCHDKHSDKQTRLDLYPEIYQRGGKIIRISGDSSQDPLTALGAVLVRREQWREFFAKNEGMVVVHSQGINYLPRERLIRRVQGGLGMEVDTEQLKAIQPKQRQRRPPVPPIAQTELDL